MLKKIRNLFGQQSQLMTLEARVKMLEGAQPVPPSTFVPKRGDLFRVRFATINDRSYMDVIWRCLAVQDGGVLASSVHGNSYSRGPKLFALGDMYFYAADELSDAFTSAETSGAQR